MTKGAIQELDREIFPHPPYSSDLAPSDYHLFRSLSNNLLGVSSNNDAELQNWLDVFFTSKPVDVLKRGIENLPERWEAVVNNGGEYIIDCLNICVKNKLFGSVKNPHELMHQPNIIVLQISLN
jgi:histone-lysine N-methyltransferase SETMAR